MGLVLPGVFGDEVMSVMEGHSVILHTDLTDLKGVTRIIWRVGEEDSNISLVTIYDNKTIVVHDDDVRFRGRLQVNNQTGDLTINNTRVKHTGRYQADLNLLNGTTYKNFSVTVSESPRVLGGEVGEVKSVSVSVSEGESVTLHTDVQTQNSTLILWRFGDEGLLIAKDDQEDNKSPIYYDVLDGMFRGRLKLDDQTGSLTITNTTATDAGLYKLQICSNNQTLYKTFNFSLKAAGASSAGAAGASLAAASPAGAAGCWCCWLLLCIYVVTTSLV
ncbi:hypothetical protein IRJ41_001428 [Triplophysa rosa]|uniref:Immunoglobulin domain-containing protein n=1 Tax=Triplophysa rosa TaxID=992332 RepID=A0A9W7T675_TRIRA|nr:hypothetical protein IRJ41_001428 [Triplophysa rosa]